MLGIILGAFAAHGLKSVLTPEALAIFQTGVQYHIYHALGLILVALLQIPSPNSGGVRTGGWLLLAGGCLFKHHELSLLASIHVGDCFFC